jgi:predicted NAD/FAD-binding protein
MKIAIIGSGISGLSVAHQLRGQADITLYEAGDYFGGHTHTVDVTLPDASGPPSPTAWTPAFWCSTSAPTRT